MKIEENTMTYKATATTVGYIDLAKNLSAVNGKSIAQTKRHDGKYKPLGFMIRVRALQGDVNIKTLNCGYPTRNSVVLAGAARDAMLKSAGISRSNLESYQKELRILLDTVMNPNGSNQFHPGGTAIGTSGMGGTLSYDYTELVMNRPDDVIDSLTKPLAMLGTQSSNQDSWDSDTRFFVVDNWVKFRHSFTPSASGDDIANNVFSHVMQQGETSADIINMIDDSQDEKPYSLPEFKEWESLTLRKASTSIGSPVTETFCAPLGLLKITPSADAIWTVEVVGVTEL